MPNNDNVPAKKPLCSFTKDEYNRLLKTGMMFEFYPEATGYYYEDCQSDDYHKYTNMQDREV